MLKAELICEQWASTEGGKHGSLKTSCEHISVRGAGEGTCCLESGAVHCCCYYFVIVVWHCFEGFVKRKGQWLYCLLSGVCCCCFSRAHFSLMIFFSFDVISEKLLFCLGGFLLLLLHSDVTISKWAFPENVDHRLSPWHIGWCGDGGMCCAKAMLKD